MSVIVSIVGVVSVVSVVSMKIAKSQDLGICACCKHNESVDICEKLVSVRFELYASAHKCYKSCIFGSECLWFTDHTHSICSNVLSAHAHNYNSGKYVKVVSGLCDTVSYMYSST